MAMNKQRRTSNINNIVVYDAAGNVTLPANLVVSGQLRLSNYTSGSSYTGTIVGFLGFDSSGNILTTTTPVSNAVTFNNAGSGDASGITYNGSAARTISYNTVGAAAASHFHDDRYLLYNSSSEISNLAVGWYTIAVNAGDRASAKFILRDVSSGNHQSTVFYATHHFGSYSDITVLSNSRYSGDPFGNIRIKTGGTYDGALLQVYIDLAASTVKTWMLENIQINGWVLKNWIPDGTDPGGVANFAALTVNSAEVNLVQIPNGGMSTTGEVYGGGNTVQYLHLHTNNYNTYAPTLTGTGASGTWGISISGNASTANYLKSPFPYNTNITDSTTAASLSEPGSLTSVNMHATHGYFGGFATTLTMSGYDRYGVYQISGNYNATVPDLVMRNYNQSIGGYTGWVRILSSSNYNTYAPTLTGGGASGTWSISVTGSAGSAAVLTASGILTTQQGNGTVIYSYALTNPQTGLFPATDNSNSILTLNRHPDSYYSQLGFSSNGNLYYRMFSGQVINTSQAWQTIWTSVSLTNLNQLTNGPGYITSSSLGAYLPLAGGTLSGKVWTVSSGDDAYGGAIEIRERGYVSNGQTDWSYSPAISFHWGNISIQRFGVRSDGLFAVDDAPIALRSWVQAYAPSLTGANASGTWGISITGNAATATTAAVSNFLFIDNSVAFGRSGLQFAQSAGPAGNDASIHQVPTADWWHVLRMNHANNVGYYADLAVSMTTNAGLARRVISGGSQLSNWVTILDALNYNSYAPTLTGGGASGTWAINITGSASIASQVTINYGNDSNSNYYLLWGSGNSVFATGNVYINPSTDTLYASAYRGNADVGGTGEATWHPAGIYCGSTMWQYGEMYKNNTGINGVSQIYINGWFRNNTNNTGLYNENTTMHWSSKDNGYWDASSTTTVSSIRFFTGSHIGTLRGYLFANSSGELGFLDSAANWILRCVGTSNTYLTGTFTASGDVVAYSDARIKTNVHTIDNALDKVISMRGVTYNRTDVDDTSEKVGVIAQEIQEVLPQVVTKDDAGMLGVSYGNLAGVFIEAFKEQQRQIEDLKKQIEFLANNQ